MKTKNLLLTSIALFAITTASMAQNISCANFSIIAINPDSIDPNTYQISINFNAAAIEFANYPHVASVLDCNGDTVATGDLFWFGQLGQTTVDYPVTLIGSISCQPLTAVFIYDNSNGTSDTCLLSFGTTGILPQSDMNLNLFGYPNPTQNLFNFKVNKNLVGENFKLYNNLGVVVLSGKINSENVSIELVGLSTGIYLLSIGDSKKQYLKVTKE